ncbi:MAG: sulfurtransferase TusA family protein [Phycisphaerae bacterium]|jgi:sulfite reductase (ferredoxin)
MSYNCLQQINDSIREDTAQFRAKVQRYINGETNAVAFRAYRVPMGVYEQRENGNYMVRIRLSAGLVLTSQLRAMADICKKYGATKLHVTTRQDIQIHDVQIEHVADVLEELLEAGLSSRGGGGNTVRNVSACPRAGVCPDEDFDVAPHAIALTEYLLQSPGSFNLPRKFKVVFSGCPTDCAMASVSDVGFFAHTKRGLRGFSVYGAGGFGNNPLLAIKLEDFIAEHEIYEVAETVKLIFSRLGDRSNKHRARLRYVLKDMGEEAFRKLYQDTREEVRAAGLPDKIPPIRHFEERHFSNFDSFATDGFPNNVLAEKVPGMYTVELRLKFGDIPVEDAVRLAELADKYSFGYIHTTQTQDLQITNVPAENVPVVCAGLREMSVDVFGRLKGNVVCCTGADTCKLGLCLSKGLAGAISEQLKDYDGPRKLIRISGCPNSCGHHSISELGFQGKAKRIGERLLPSYDLFYGGRMQEGDSALAQRVGTIPAKDIPAFVEEYYRADRSLDAINKLLEAYGDFTRDFPDDYFYDYGAKEEFSLKGRGPGECSASIMDVVKLDIDRAKDCLRAAASGDEQSNYYSALICAARSLLVLRGHKPRKDREVVELFGEELLEQCWVGAEAGSLLEAALNWKLGDVDKISEDSSQVQAFVDRIEALFKSLNAQLAFTLEPAVSKEPQQEPVASRATADLRGVACPLNFVKAKLALEKLELGSELEVLLDDGEPIRNVPESFKSQGQEIVEIKPDAEHFRLVVKRLK